MLASLLIALLAISAAAPGRACEHAKDAFALTGPGREEARDVFQAPAHVERMFRGVPDATSAERTLRHLTRHAHLAGSLEDFALADFVKNAFEHHGHADHVFVDDVPALLSFPRKKPRVAAVDGNSHVVFEAGLEEDILPEDQTSGGRQRNQTFNGYAPSGKAQARLVYANFGSPADFKVLEDHNVLVQGSIVLVRYGQCFRGLKVMNAEQRGAVGVLIYSDPAQDGFVVGDVYPAGPWRPASSVQRGSVQFNSLCSGDPLRVASGFDSMQQCGYRAEDLRPQIPVLPLSYRDALPLLKLLRGPVGPDDFRGGLQGCDYRLGPSDAQVLMEVDNLTPVAMIRNVVAVYKGEHFATDKDMPIILGNHRDAWVFGAADPGSGTTAMLEMIRGFGVLKQHGWRPRRTIVVASWDGEELGLVGSTAFVESRLHGALLKRAAAYINVDVGVAGPMFQLAASPSLATVIRGVLDDVMDPSSGGNRTLAEASWDGEVSVLGSGSDYTAFVDYAGIASADLRFSPRSGEGSVSGVGYGTYHSTFDSFDWMARFGDKGFAYHATMSVVWGLVALRLADSPLLPLDHVYGAKAVDTFVQQVKHQVSSDVQTQLRQAVAAYKQAALALNRPGAEASSAALATYNERVGLAERLFLSPPGLPRRKWFKHVLQAPALYLGYAADVLPGVQQAFRDESNPELADVMAEVVADRIEKVARWLKGNSNEAPFV